MADNGKISIAKDEKGCSLGQSFFLGGEQKMKNYDAKSALPVILQAARDYDKKLRDRHFSIIYRKKTGIESCCVGFRDMHFLHLTGVKTKAAPCDSGSCQNHSLV